MRVAAVLLLLAAAIAAHPRDLKGLAEKKTTKSNDKSNLVELHRYYDAKLHEHVYTYRDAEALVWLADPTKSPEESIGYALTTLLPGTRRLYRAVRTTDGMHFFYLQAPLNLTPVLRGAAERQGRPPGEQLRRLCLDAKRRRMVPIHGCCLPDGTDVFLDPELRKVGRFANDKLKAVGIQPRTYQGAFYLYPKEKPPASLPGKKK